MQTFIDRSEFCDCVMDAATAQSWDLRLVHGTGMRYSWQWSWKGCHALPERASMFPSEAEAKFAACLELVGQTGWRMQVNPGVEPPMELVPASERQPGMADVLGLEEPE